MPTRYVYLNGRIVPEEEAAISPFDIGLLRGYAVFDLLRTVRLRPFLLPEHLRRLRESADHLGLGVPATDEEMPIDRRVARMGTPKFVPREALPMDGIEADSTFLSDHELRWLPDALRANNTAHSRHVRDIRRQRRRTTSDAEVCRVWCPGPVVPSRGLSGSREREFHVVRGRTIVAPSSDVLRGTVGALVLDRAQDRYEVVCAEVTLADACCADEAFITSTTRGVVPIVALDDTPIGSGQVGPITRDLMELFRQALLEA
jgi:hypothetical protein